MVRLIVNADDYGLTQGINRGIERCFATGSVTSATLMVGGRAAGDAASFASSHPALSVGCHIVLVDGHPLSPPGDVRTLLQPRTNVLYASLGGFVRALLMGTIRPEHIAIEAANQLQQMISLGIQPTHVDTHKHTHMFPDVCRAILPAAAAAGVTRIRNPFEPAWAVNAAPGAGAVRRIEVTTLRAMYCQRFLQAVRENNFVTTDGAIGVTATGSLNLKALQSLADAIPAGTWELVTHPGYADDLAGIRTRLRASREVELSALQQLPGMLGDRVQRMAYGDLHS